MQRVQRVREMLAHGGIAILAVVFALAFAAYQTASALAQTVVFTFNQAVGDEDFSPLAFDVFGTSIYLDAIVQSALALLLLGAVLWTIWRLTRATVRKCPECRSQIARDASICRYCTTELTSGGG